MTYLEIFDNIFASPELEKRVVVACLTAADAILREPVETPNHELRLHWARVILTNPLAGARKMIPAIMTNTDVQNGTAQDEDVLWIVNYTLDTYAEVV